MDERTNERTNEGGITRGRKVLRVGERKERKEDMRDRRKEGMKIGKKGRGGKSGEKK